VPVVAVAGHLQRSKGEEASAADGTAQVLALGKTGAIESLVANRD
jgi:hypothetical protein